jgi:hypothetical protein
VTVVVVEPYRLAAPRGPGEYRVYLTLFESDRIPGSWAARLNADACEVRRRGALKALLEGFVHPRALTSPRVMNRPRSPEGVNPA